MPPTAAHPRQTNGIHSIWRCGDAAAAFPLFSGVGAGLYPGRWNLPSSPLIYASETFSTALLEKLVILGGELPRAMHGVEILVPDGISIEHFNAADIPDWVNRQYDTKVWGDGWFKAQRTLLLRVPSVCAALIDHNILINPLHPEFSRLQDRVPFPIAWDRRLFRPAAEPRQSL